MKNYLFCSLICLISFALLTCGKYRPGYETTKNAEWIYSVKLCSCVGGNLFLDTIRPDHGRNGIWSAKIRISDNHDENTVHLYLNENLAAAVQFDYLESGDGADYPGNLNDDYGIRLYSETDSFLYSIPSDIAGYPILIETPDFPFKSDIYENEMDTFTVNFFKFID
jgi:hypothetical protein